MFIGTGSFIIRGKRNFLNPQRLELGFTLMFCISEESLANHIGERHCREDIQELEAEMNLQRAASQQEDLADGEAAAQQEGQDDAVARQDSMVEKILK